MEPISLFLSAMVIPLLGNASPVPKPPGPSGPAPHPVPHNPQGTLPKKGVNMQWCPSSNKDMVRIGSVDKRSQGGKKVEVICSKEGDPIGDSDLYYLVKTSVDTRKYFSKEKKDVMAYVHDKAVTLDNKGSIPQCDKKDKIKTLSAAQKKISEHRSMNKVQQLLGELGRGVVFSDYLPNWVPWATPDHSPPSLDALDPDNFHEDFDHLPLDTKGCPRSIDRGWLEEVWRRYS